MNANVAGVLAMTKAFLPLLKKGENTFQQLVNSGGEDNRMGSPFFPLKNGQEKVKKRESAWQSW
jgi:hypothetical protein